MKGRERIGDEPSIFTDTSPEAMVAFATAQEAEALEKGTWHGDLRARAWQSIRTYWERVKTLPPTD